MFIYFSSILSDGNADNVNHKQMSIFYTSVFHSGRINVHSSYLCSLQETLKPIKVHALTFTVFTFAEYFPVAPLSATVGCRNVHRVEKSIKRSSATSTSDRAVPSTFPLAKVNPLAVQCSFTIVITNGTMRKWF